MSKQERDSGNDTWTALGVIAVLVLVAGAAHPHPAAPVTPAQSAPIAGALAVASVPSGPGVVYTFAQLEQALQAAAVAQPVVGAAIAEAESHGRSDAVCDSCAGVREYSVGPWQINELAHPWVTSACAMSLNCAAAAVRVISNDGANWTPWSTYASGAWRAYASG